MEIAEYCLQNNYWILRNTVYRLLNRYCPILYRKFNGYHSILSDHTINCSNLQNSMDTTQYYPQNIQWILQNTPHKILNFYCSIISTEYSWILLSTVYRIFNGYCAILSTDLFDTLHRTCNGYCTVLSTDYWIDIAQYHPQTIECFRDCTTKSNYIWMIKFCSPSKPSRATLRHHRQNTVEVTLPV
jgi:hypothetical protein